MTYTFGAERPGAQEVYDLFDAAGWTPASVRAIKTSLSAYPCKVCARASDGTLIGYASVFSDEVMTTMLGELLVHPLHRKVGVGSGIMGVIESLFPNAPVYIKALGESKHFYERLGYRVSKTEMTVMFKKPWQVQAQVPPGVNTTLPPGAPSDA